MYSIKVKLITPTAKAPVRAYESAAYDLFADEDVVIHSGNLKKVKLGIAVEFPAMYVAHLWDRSGMGSKGIHSFAGVIDPDYRGEWSVCLFNFTDKPFTIRRGDKIIQVVFQKVEHPVVEIVEQLIPSSRGEKGWGSTG